MKDKENRQFHIRSRGLVAVLAAVLIGFGYVLYDLQIVHGAEYRERSQRKIAQTETVEAARGSLLDRYGRELVTNRTSYNVALETSRMGEDKNAVLLELLDICREQEVEWTDTLPVSAQAPYVFTLDTASDLTVTRLQKLCTQLKWTDLIPTEDEIAAMRPAPAETAPARDEEAEETLPAEPKAPAVSAQPLLDKMKEYFGLDETLPNQEARGLLGVLYELALRSKGITTVSYVFAKDVDIQFITAVKEAGLAGVRIDTKSVRQYRTPYAAHLLGRVGLMDETEQAYYRTLGYDGDESVGKEGVEQAFESWLKGTDGKKAVETNTEGKVISETYKEEPVPGGHVALTLDIRLQEVAERALAEGIAGLKSEDTQGGALVAIDVSDGGVLALARYPTYDRTTIYSDNEAYNAALNDPLKPFYNRALLGQYAPGSTFKMVTAVGGLEEDIIEPSTEIRDTGRYMYYAPSYTPMCWYYRQYGGTHGNENVSEAIRDSCNIFFYDVGRRLGIDRLDQYARMFGLGESTGIELKENTGMVAGPDASKRLEQTWYEGQTLAAAIGQDNNQFTPLQLANYIATLVNGGTHYSAHLLKSVKSYDYSEVLYEREPEVLDTIEIAPENLNAVLEGMRLVAAEGGTTYRFFKDLPVTVGAKTGSAQVSSTTESNAVFVCFAPYEDPEIALAVVVEKGGSGMELAAIAADVLEYYFSTGTGLEAAAKENTLLR